MRDVVASLVGARGAKGGVDMRDVVAPLVGARCAKGGVI